MSTQSKSWLQLYVDAMMEKDPFKRLNLVRALHTVPREDDFGEPVEKRTVKRLRKSRRARRR